jgi:Tol biopolymer transport system component
LSGWPVHTSYIPPLAVAALAAIAVLFSGAPLANGAFPGRNGLIAYTEDDCGGGSRVATMRPDGTGRRLLTPPTCSGELYGPVARYPAWSPDGRQLVFDYTECCIEGIGDTFPIYSFALTDPDGLHRRLLPLPPPPYVHGQHFQRYGASFAPDGMRIVYHHSGRGNDPSDSGVAVASLDGQIETRLGPPEAHLPRWSPDGRWIAYVADPYRTPEEPEGGTWLMDAQTGTHRRKIWRPSAASLDWSPNGRSLLASTSQSCRSLIDLTGCHPARLYRLSITGERARRIVRVPRRARFSIKDGEAVWSPNGRRIAFVRERGQRRQWEIWTARADGSHPRRIWKRFDGFDSDRSSPTLSWQPRP